MSERNGYEPGVPCWVDLSTPDVTESARFYQEIFGWDVRFDPRPGSGGYGQFTLREKAVGGIGATPDDRTPAAWNTYVATDDIEATADAVSRAGGRVVAGPMEVFEEGAMAAFQDPAGAYVMAWQARRHPGARLVNEPTAFCWNELTVRDTAAALDFYPQVFGWGVRTIEMDGAEYTEWLVGEQSVAGMRAMDETVPPEVPPHWLTYFAVHDCDETVEKVLARGGTVFVEPLDAPVGRFAVMADPRSAAFAVIRLNVPA
jgi:predicted enzyme related to lactoylglutathione lyase